MRIQINGSHVHWNYLLALEQDLIKVARFIEFTKDNFNTYSIELAHLLLAASSEVDVVLKALCNIKKPDVNHQTICHYKNTIKAELSGLINDKCYIHRYGLELEPWSIWNGNENPIWWQSYNNVKHQRDKHFSEANLENTLNAMAGLSLVVLYYYRESFAQEMTHTFKEVTRRLQPKTELIEFSDEYETSEIF